MKKRLFATLLSLVMLVGLLPTTVFAEEITSVAEIGNTKYETLIEAVKAAQAGDTITLVDDCTMDMDGATITLPDGVTLDLNKNTLTTPFSDKTPQTKFSGTNITIKNGTITNGRNQNQSYGLYIMSGSFTIEDVTTTNGINISAGTVTLKDVDVTNPNSSYYAVYSAGNVTILSGTFQNTSKKHSILYGNITVYGGTFSKDPNKFLAEGYWVTQSDNKYTVISNVKGASAYYPTLQSAVNAGETNLTLLANMDEDFVIEEDESTDFTLNLGEFKLESTITVHHKIHTVQFTAAENNESVIYLTDPAGAHDVFLGWCSGTASDNETPNYAYADHPTVDGEEDKSLWVAALNTSYHTHFEDSGLVEIDEDDRHLYFTKAEYGYTVTDTMARTFTFQVKTDAPSDFSASITKFETAAYFDAVGSGLTVTIKPKAGLPTGKYEEKIYVIVQEGEIGTSNHELFAFFEVTKANSTVTPSAEPLTYEYGDTIPLTAAIAKAETGITALATEDTVEFFCGGESLGTAQVSYEEESNNTTGTATLSYDTTNGKLVIGSNTITATYGGSVNLNGSQSNSITIKLTARALNESQTFTVGETIITGPATVSPDSVTVAGGGKIGDIEIPTGVTITVPADKLAEVKTETTSDAITGTTTSETTLPEGSTVTTGDPAVTIDVVSGDVTVDGDGNVDVPQGGKVEIGDTTVTGPATITDDGKVKIEEGGEIDGVKVPDNTTIEVPTDKLGEVTTTPGTGEGESENGTITLPAGSTVTTTDEEGKSTTVDVTQNGTTVNPDGTITCPSSGGSSRPSYSVTAPEAENGAVKLSPASAKAGQTVTVTVTPDEGYQVGSLTILDKNGEPVEVADNGDGTYSFKMPAGKVSVEVTFETIPPVTNPFTDVSPSDWFYGDVMAAYDRGLMNGVSPTTFDPEGVTTRAMTWTVLARLAGQTIQGADWASDAQSWAVDAGISDGTAPGDNVTRQQLVTMLYRFVDTPAASADLSAFVDSHQISPYAVDAMAWAVASGILQGDDQHQLNPGAPATRAEMAAILMRFCAAMAL